MSHHITREIGPEGALVDVIIGVFAARRHAARAKHISDRIEKVEQHVYDAVRANSAPSTPRVWWNKFVEGWKHGAGSA